MQNRSLIAMRLSAFFLVALVAGVLAATVARAAPTLSVSLVYFRGESQESAARLEWRTATEDNTAGFKLERGPSADGPFTYLADVGMIPARGSVSTGDTYEALDATVSNGQTYWYRLIEVEYDNSEAAIDTVEVAIAGPTATPEPVTGGSDPGATPESPPTSTPEPTQANSGDDGAAPTSTRSGGSAATPTATNTGQTATATPGGNNNRPTNTPPPSPTRMTFNQDDEEQGTGSAEAAEPSSIAQVTPTESADGYPGPADETPEDAPAVEDEGSANDAYPGPAEAQLDEPSPEGLEESGYPAGAVGANGEEGQSGGQRAVGANDAPATGSDEAQEAPESNLGRVVLWVGFAFALLVFIGGTIFAIVLSTRKRHNNLS